MGCGVSGQLNNDSMILSEQIKALSLEKEVIYDDRISLISEVAQLQANFKNMLEENEILKQRIDKMMSSAHPELFEDFQSQDEIIANWIEMDLRDGDVLLEALGILHQASQEEVQAMLEISTDLRKRESSLQQYCSYFSERFGLFNNVWKRAVEVQFQLDSAFQRLREDTAQSVQSVESILGKRSPPLESLQSEFRDLLQLKNADFIFAQHAITHKIFAIKVENFNKKLEDKEIERQRVINWYDGEIGRIKTAHAKEMTETEEKNKAEIARLAGVERDREEMMGQDLLACRERSRIYLENTIETHKKTVAGLKSDFQDEKKAIFNKIEAMKTAHSREIERMNREHEDFKALVKDRERLIFEDVLGMNMRFAADMEKVKANQNATNERYELGIKDTAKKHIEEVELLTWQYTEDRNSLQTRLEKRVKEFLTLQQSSEKNMTAITRRAFEEKQSLISVQERLVADKERTIKDMKEALEREVIRREKEVKQAVEGHDEQLQAIVNEHMQEFANLRRKQAIDTEKHEVAVQKLQEQHEQFVANLIEKNRTEIDQIRQLNYAELQKREEQLRKTQTESQIYVTEMIEKYRSDIARLTALQQADLKRKDDFLADLRTAHQAQLDALSTSHIQEMEESRKKHTSEIDQKDAGLKKLREEIDLLRSQFQTDIERKDQQLVSKMQEHQEETTTFIEKYDAEMRKLRTAHAELIEKKETALEKALETHRAEIRFLSLKSTEEKENMQKGYTEEMRNKNAEILRVKTDLETKLEETIRKAEREAAEMKKEYTEVIQLKEDQAKQMQMENDAKLAAIVDKYREDLIQAREHHQSDTKRKDEHVDKVQTEHQRYINELVEKYTKEIAQLRSEYAEELRRRDELQISTTKEAEAHLSSIVSKLTSDIDVLNKTHSQELSQRDESAYKSRSDFDLRIQEMNSSYMKEMQEIRDLHRDEIQRREIQAASVQKEHSLYVASLMDKFRSDLAETRTQQKEELSRKEAKLTQMQIDHQSQVSDLMEKQSREIIDLKLSHGEEIRKKELQVETLIKSNEIRMQEIVQKQREELIGLHESQNRDMKLKEEREKALITAYETKLTTATEQFSQDLGKAKQEYSDELQRKEDQLRSAAAEHSTQVHALIDKFMREATSQRSNFDQEIKHLTESLEFQRTEYEATIQSMKLRHLDRIKTLESNHALEIAEKNRIAQEKESEKAANLQKLMDQFSRQTSILRESHMSKQDTPSHHRSRSRTMPPDHHEKNPVPSNMTESGLPIVSETDLPIVSETDLPVVTETDLPIVQETDLPIVQETYLTAAAEIDLSFKMISDATETAFSRAFQDMQDTLEREKQGFALEIARNRETIQELETECQDLEEKCAKLEQEIGTNEATITDLETTLLDRDTEIDSLNSALSDSQAEISSLNQIIEKKDEIVENLEAELANLKAEIKKVQNMRDDLLMELERYRESVAELQHTMDDYKGLSLREQIDLQNQVRRTLEDISHRDMKIKELAETVREKESVFSLEIQRKSLKSLLSHLITRILNSKKKVFLLWRYHRRDTIPQPPPTSRVRGKSVHEPHSELEEIWQEELHSLLENNNLLDIYKKTGRGEKPLALNQVLKVYEEIMDRKFEADLADFKAHRAVQSLQDFVVEHLTRTFGLRKLALKMVCQLVPALITGHRDQQPEVVLFCRLLQIINPSPVPKQLAVFLTRVRVEFGKYAKSYQLERNIQTAANADRASLVDIFAYIYALFEDDSICGTDVLRRIRPDSVPLDQYVLFKICNKMAILGMNSEEVFSKMDADASGRMSESEFVAGVRRVLELWISESDLQVVFTILARNGTLLREEFVSVLNFKQYLEKCKSDVFTITKTAFLTCLIDVYTAKQLRDAAEIKVVLGPVSYVDEIVHSALLYRMKPGIQAEQVKALWKSGTDKMTVFAYVKLLLHAGILPQGVFGMA